MFLHPSVYIKEVRPEVVGPTLAHGGNKISAVLFDCGLRVEKLEGKKVSRLPLSCSYSMNFSDQMSDVTKPKNPRFDSQIHCYKVRNKTADDYHVTAVWVWGNSVSIKFSGIMVGWPLKPPWSAVHYRAGKSSGARSSPASHCSTSACIFIRHLQITSSSEQ